MIALTRTSRRRTLKDYGSAVSVPETLRRLLTTAGPSGYEGHAAAVWREAASAFAEVTSDVMGSSVARVKGTQGGPLVAVVGHIDEIGIMVTHVDDKGFVAFRGVGGWHPEVLRAQRVEIQTRDGPVAGVIGRKHTPPPKRGEERKPTELEELHVDIGAKDGEDAKRLVRVGDVAVLVSDPLELPNRRVASRSMDNRLGCYVALEAARLVAEAGGAPGDVAAVAAVQEEVGDFGGARTIAFSLEPAVAIVVDVTYATDIPGGDPKLDGAHGVGSGPAIGRGSTVNPKVFELLYEAAEAEEIAFTIEASMGDTHTDLDAIHLSRAGVATGLVSIPTRYIHSPTEMVSLDDVEACARLIAAFARRLPVDASFTR
jgi:putative aminopeptidase FrvX